MIAVLLDQGLAPRAAVILREKGLMRSRVCVTLDHDFHAHLALAREGKPSVVLLRIEGLNAAAQAAMIESICRRFEDPLSQGAAISADQNTVRIRLLPLR